MQAQVQLAEDTFFKGDSAATDTFQAVNEMSVSLQALERAVYAGEHSWVQKGLEMESATSARLVHLV
jgi:hypothetical protein